MTELGLVSQTMTSSQSALPNIANHQLPIKLKSSNFLLWKQQITPLLNSYGVDSHIADGHTAPAATVNNAINPEFVTWFRQDQMVLSWLINSISEQCLSQVVGSTIALEAWKKLSTSYASGSKAQIRTIKGNFYKLHKDSTESIV